MDISGVGNEASKVSNFRSKSSYADAVRVSYNNCNVKDDNMCSFFHSNKKIQEKVEVNKWNEEIYDSSWINLCVVGVFKKFFDVAMLTNRCRERNI